VTSYPYGGFWRRAAAAVIDQIILGIIYTILLMIGTAAGLGGFNTHSYTVQSGALLKSTSSIMILYHIFCVVINAAYFTYFHGIMGQTPGKMVMNLKVVQVSGEAITPGIAFLRWVGYIVSCLFLFLGYLWVAFDRRKQGWHDKIAGTVVILKDRRVTNPETVEPTPQDRAPESGTCES